VTEENRDEILMKNLMEQCDEKLMDLLDDKKVFYVNNVNHYRNLYAVCIDTDFNWLMSLVFVAYKTYNVTFVQFMFNHLRLAVL
jgi:hypothetical protein